MNQSKKITQAAILIAIYVILLLSAVLIPGAILLLFFILPIPFVFYAANHGLKPALLMLTGALVFSVVFIITLPITMIAGIMGIVIGMGIHHKRSVYEIFIRTTAGALIGSMFFLLFFQFAFDINLLNSFDVMVKESLEMTEALVVQFGIDKNQPEFYEQLAIVEAQMYEFKRVLPAVIAIGSMIVAFITQWLSYVIVNRINRTKLKFPKFRDVNFPKVILWIYLIVIMFTIADINEESTLYLVVLNTFTLLSFLFVIQGLSFIFKYAYEKKIHIAIPIVFVVISILAANLLMVFVRILGIIDIGFSLKKRMENVEKR